MTYRILLVEDDESLGATLEERLVKQGYQVSLARTVTAAKQLLGTADFHLAILDVGLPDGSGYDVAALLRKSRALPFLFLTAESDPVQRLRGYEFGAEEYIPKPFHLKELLLRVQHVLERHVGATIVQLGNVKIDFDGLMIERPGMNKESLAARDMAVLKLLWDLAPTVVSRDRILEVVWGAGNFPSNRTVDNVIVRIRQALGDDDSLLIRSVRGVGYQLMKGNSE